MAGLWEFPGGKLEFGEAPEKALARELAEELGIVVDPANLSPACFASEPLGDRNLLLMLYVCSAWSGDPAAMEQQDIDWFRLDQMEALPMPPADLPLIKQLKQLRV